MDIKDLYIYIYICKDIFFHSRYSGVYPFISFMSSNLFIDTKLFIHLYPLVQPFNPRAPVVGGAGSGPVAAAAQALVVAGAAAGYLRRRRRRQERGAGKEVGGREIGV